MGTKRHSSTQYDTPLNQSIADHPHQPDRGIPTVASQRAPSITGPSDRNRGRLPEEERRGARAQERMKDNPRNKKKDGETMEWQGRELALEPRTRGGGRERERHRVEERLRNGRPVSHLDPVSEYYVDKEAGKGGTYPRMRKHSKERATIMTALREEEIERDRKGLMERHKRTEGDRETEREIEQAQRTERHAHRERYRERERDGVRPRFKDDGGRRTRDERTLLPRERRKDPDHGFSERRRGEREGDTIGLRDRREREIARERERSKPRSRDIVRKVHSPHRRDGEVYSERDTWERAKARDAKRDTKSEGDGDGGAGRQRVRDSEREAYHPSRSEGENREQSMRKNGGDQPRYRDNERQRHREGRDQYRERDGRKDRNFAQEPRRKDDAVGDQKERKPDSRQGPSDRRESEQYRHRVEEKQDKEGRYRERAVAEERRYREEQERPAFWHQGDPTGSSAGRKAAIELAPRASPQGRSSGEWSSDLDSESRGAWTRDHSHEEKESEGDSMVESDLDAGRDSSDMEAVQRRDDALRSADKRRVGSSPGQEHRRMWLEPQRRKCSNDSSLDDELVEMCTRRQPDKTLEIERWSSGESGEAISREPEELCGSLLEGGRLVGRSSDPEGETEGVSVDAEDEAGEKREVTESHGGDTGRGIRDLGQGHGKDGAHRGDIEAGSDSLRSESEGGSEQGWDRERDKRFSGEDGFITVSSGGDEEDEREDEEFEDCRESWEEGHPDHGSHLAPLRGGVKTGRHSKQSEDKEYRSEEDKEEREAEDRQRTSHSPLSDGGAKSTKYVFCVIGQPPAHTQLRELEKVEAGVPGRRLSCGDETVARPRSDSHPILFSGAADHGDQQTRAAARSLSSSATRDPPSDECSNATKSSSQTEKNMEHPYAEIGALNRNVRTEMLLAQWREKQKEYTERSERCQVQEEAGGIAAPTHGDAAAQQWNSVPTPNHPQTIDPEAVGQGEEEEEQEVSIRIRMSGAWSMAEEAKRHSQAPHLKWANSVMREILGSSEDHTLNTDASGPQAEARPEGDTGPDAATTSGVTWRPPQGSDQESGPEADEGRTETPDSDELRGRAQGHGVMHAEPADDTHRDTPAYTHIRTHVVVQGPETHADPEAGGPAGDGEGDGTREEMEIAAHEEATSETEAETYLSVGHTLYKPRSCPCLNYDTEEFPLLQGHAMAAQHDSDQEGARRVRDGEQAAEESMTGGAGVMVRCRGSGSEWSGEDQVQEGGEVAGAAPGRQGPTVLSSSCSFRDLGPEARMRRRGIRKTTERRKEERVEEEEEEDEGAGRDRRTRIFSTTDENPISKSWGEVELRAVLEAAGQTKRFFNAAPLYQQYSEDAQNIEILRQSQFDAEHPSGHPHLGPPVSAPAAPSGPASRPLPPLPPVPHPHSLSIPVPVSRGSGSAKNLPLPETPKPESRSTSPRLSISLGKASNLWQDLPGVCNSPELSHLSEDQRRLQEVRFEVVTSEASYCRSLDIVVEHFVKSKQLGALLTSQDSNWLFSRFADVRAISHSFMSKLEEKVESDMLHFTVCDVIARHCQRFKMVYVPYLTNQSYQDATYQRLMNENQRFRRIVEKLERSPVCQRLPLRSFLILPFQRITRIKLLVQNIVKRTAPDTEEVVQAIKALKLLEKMIQESNESISQMKSIESLVSLSAMVDFECKTLPLVSQSRRLLREGPVTELMEFSVKDTERGIYLHLFNDHLLLSLHKEGGKFTVIDHSPVSYLRAENCRVALHSVKKNLFRLHLSQRALLLRTETQSDKLRWISAISKPHPVLDFATAQDCTQMQCIRAFIAQQPDELSLEKADVILVHQQSGEGWVEGTKLSDRHRGWMPAAHLENINNPRVCQRNLLDALKLTTATATM